MFRRQSPDRRVHGHVPALLLAAALVVLVPEAHAQTPEEPLPQAHSYTWRSWTREDGLSGSQVWAIAQDQRGYLWVGTNEGLARFDGVSFVLEPTLGGGRLPVASVHALFVARDGSLWMGFAGRGGVSRLDGTNVRNFDREHGLPETVVNAVLEDRAGAMWAASLSGLYRLQGDRWEHIGESFGLHGNAVSVFEDTRGRLWVGSSSGVYRRQAGSDQFAPATPLRVESFAEDREGRIWGTGLDALLVRLDVDVPAPVRGMTARSAGGRLLDDGDGNLWIGTWGDGLLRVSMRGDRFEVEPFTGIDKLSSNFVRSLLRDGEGNLWLGTQRGLDRATRTMIRSWPPPSTAAFPVVRAVVAAHDASVWVATGDGLLRFNHGQWQHFAETSGLLDRAIRTLYVHTDGELWVATASGIGRFLQGRFELVFATGGQLNRPVALTKDRDGNVWVCDIDRGLFRWNGRELESVSATWLSGGQPAVSILTDSRNRVWAGFIDGTLGVLEGGAWRLYTTSDHLTGGMVASLYEDRNGDIWIGASGLVRYRHGRFEAMTSKNGLPANVGAITEDDAGNLWLGVSSGIVRFAPAEFDKAVASSDRQLTYELYDFTDGLRGDPIGLAYPSVARERDGTLWFVTTDGLAVLRTAQTAKIRLPPPVTIESANVDQQRIALDDDRPLPPLAEHLQINYAAMSFTAPQKVRFRYLLEGFDRDWVDAGTRRQAFYTNLRPGRYRFRVTASNDGVPSEREALWEFSLAPAYYQTQWFLVVMALLAGAGAAGVWRMRVHQVRSRFSIILLERARVAREIHDTLLQSLLGVHLRLDQIANTIDVSSEEAKRNLQRLRQQVGFYVREARYSIKGLRSPLLASYDLAKALREFGERLTTMNTKPITLTVVESGEPHTGTSRGDEHLLRIGQEAISNAVRHGHPTVIQVELRYDQKSVTLSVTDDGTGFDVDQVCAQIEDHWGLMSMRERAEQLGGTLRLVSNRETGTHVAVTVPIAAAA